jgi:hypothetical protein
VAWLPTYRGLSVPTQRGQIDPASPLAIELSSLWVPAIGQSDNGLINLAPHWQVPMTHTTASNTPTLYPTDFGPGFRYDGSNNYSIRASRPPFQPHVNIFNTLAVTCIVNTMPTGSAFGQVYGFTNNSNSAGRAQLDIKDSRVRFWYTGNSGSNASYAEIFATFTANELMMITVCTDSYTTTRLSVFEPRTGRFLQNTNTIGTNTQTSLATWPIQNETLGARFWNNSVDTALGVTVLDAWFWYRSLSDEDLEFWRYNRWGVFQPDRSKTAYFYNQGIDIPSTLFSVASQYTPGTLTVIPGAIITSRLFVSSVTLAAGVATIIRNALIEGFNFEIPSEMVVVGDVDAEPFSFAAITINLSSEFTPGTVEAVGSVNLGGVAFFRNVFLDRGAVNGLLASQISGVSLEFGASLTDGGVSADEYLLVAGQDIASSVSLIAGQLVGQRSAITRSVILEKNVTFVEGISYDDIDALGGGASPISRVFIRIEPDRVH